MKYVFSILTLLASGSAFAHGAVAQQGSDAIKAATGVFLAKATPAVRKEFYSVSATVAGHEQFAVVIMLKDQRTRFEYDCRENEEVNPVVWECAAL
jgi:hypothetical protein